MKTLTNLINKIVPFTNNKNSTYESCNDYTRFMDYYAPAYDSTLQSVVAEYEASRN